MNAIQKWTSGHLEMFFFQKWFNFLISFLGVFWCEIQNGPKVDKWTPRNVFFSEMVYFLISFFLENAGFQIECFHTSCPVNCPVIVLFVYNLSLCIINIYT